MTYSPNSFFDALKPNYFMKFKSKKKLWGNKIFPIITEFYKDIENLKLISCYSNEGNKWKKSKIKFISEDVLEIYIDEKFIGERGRINCSLRDSSGFWRWLGIQFVIAEK